MFRHILPNVSHVVLVQLSILTVGFIKAEVILSYLGLGVPVDQVSWGTMLAEAQSELILGHWWQLAAATLFMAVFVTAFSLMTDALRDALDPKLRGLGDDLTLLHRSSRSVQRRASACGARCQLQADVRRWVGQRVQAGVQLRHRREQHRGAGRRIGLGQERHRDVHPQPAARQRRAPRAASSTAGATCCRPALTELQALRGREIACVFQDPMSSLNPVLPVGLQLCEPLLTHLEMSPRQARERAEALLAEVGMPEPKRRLDAYPHELSGGQQQRVMIAMALACEPKLLIADEPTTALDVTIQRQILELLATLKARHRMSLLFISHDLGLVGEIADRVVVMRHGQVREQGPVAQIFAAPQDAYTRALLACRPSLSGPPPARLRVIDEFIAGDAAAPAPGAAKDPQRAGGAGGARAGQVLLAAPGPVRQARVQGGARRQLRAAARPHAGRGRRIGLGQDHDGPDAAAAARAQRRRGAVRRPRPVATPGAWRCAGASRSCSRTPMRR